MKVLTASNGRPYCIKKDGRARFLSDADAKKAGWKSGKAKPAKTRKAKGRKARKSKGR